MYNVACVILGGGQGARLYPLTKDRSKPAVPFAGRYRLIDIPISNCLHAGFDSIYILTQFNSRSLNRHVSRTYPLAPFRRGFVEVLAAELSSETSEWYQETADAVRRCLTHFEDPGVKIDYVIVLSGDQLYKMDLRHFLNYHIVKKADITIACNVMPETSDISRFGVVGVDEDFHVNNFVEKPKEKATVENLLISSNGERRFLASMGIYAFNKDVLVDILLTSDKDDFGKEIIPEAFPRKHTVAYEYEGYWQDVGSIRSYYEQNLAFTDPIPPMDLFDANWPFFTRPRYLPPSKFNGCEIVNSIIAEGVIVLNGSHIRHSVVGLRSRIAEDTTVEDSIIIGNDYYETLDDINRSGEKGLPIMGIGHNTVIKRAIIDKNVRIGNNVRIENKQNLTEADEANYIIRDEIVIIPKGAIIPDGTVI